MNTARIIVIGVGNADRGDDGVGRVVAQHLKRTLGDMGDVIEHDGEATSLLAKMEGGAAAYLIDASSSGAPAGTVRRFDAHDDPLPETASDISTHGFGVGSAIALGRALGQLPKRTIVIAIEGASFTAGAPLSAPVAAAAEQVAKTLTAEIDAARAKEKGHA